MEIRKGGCLCGNVSFEAKGEPGSASICHCRTCQRAAGADSVAWAQFPIAEVTWSGGRKAVCISSPGVERTFCPECGSSLSYQNEATSVDLVLACFEDPESISPSKEIWLDHRRSWNALNTELPGYAQFSDQENGEPS